MIINFRLTENRVSFPSKTQLLSPIYLINKNTIDVNYLRNVLYFVVI